MGRPSVQRDIIKWLHEAASKRYVIKRQFYTSAQLYILYNNTTCDNHIKSDEINKFKVKAFTTHQQKKTRHRSVREYDIQSLEIESHKYQSEDSKEHIVRCLVKEMILH